MTETIDDLPIMAGYSKSGISLEDLRNAIIRRCVKIDKRIEKEINTMCDELATVIKEYRAGYRIPSYQTTYEVIMELKAEKRGLMNFGNVTQKDIDEYKEE